MMLRDLLIRVSLVRVQQGEPKNNPVFDMNIGFFLTFLPVLKWGSSTFWVNFGSLGSKTCFCGSLRPVPWADFFMLFFGEERQRYTRKPWPCSPL